MLRDLAVLAATVLVCGVAAVALDGYTHGGWDALAPKVTMDWVLYILVALLVLKPIVCGILLAVARHIPDPDPGHQQQPADELAFDLDDRAAPAPAPTYDREAVRNALR